MAKKYKVGYTTGVFDLFHIGHLNILRKAKEQCDFLIVGVSTDELVMEYKNKTPIIPYNERCEIVESIIYVDKVVPQKNRDKIEAYKELGFNVMFVGDDWKDSPLFNQVEETFRKLNVDVVYFPYTKTSSTTSIVQFIRTGIKQEE